MKLFDFLKKNDLDEMQEQAMLKIEHRGFWLAYFGVFVLFMAQLLIYEGDFRMAAGEFVLLMLLSAYAVGASLKAGIWSRRLKPNLKTNVMGSLVGGVIVALLLGGSSYIRYGFPLVAGITALSGFVCTFVLTLVLLQISLREYKKQREKLDHEEE